MKKIWIFLVLILCLISCGEAESSMNHGLGDGTNDALTITMSSGKKIYLYMPREEAEAVLGKAVQEKSPGLWVYEEGGVPIINAGYTDGLLSYAIVKNSTVNIEGYTLGDKVEDFDGFIYDWGKGSGYIRVYDQEKNAIPLTGDEIKNLGSSYRDYGRLDIMTSEDGEISMLSIADDYAGRTMDFDQ